MFLKDILTHKAPRNVLISVLPTVRSFAASSRHVTTMLLGLLAPRSARRIAWAL